MEGQEWATEARGKGRRADRVRAMRAACEARVGAARAEWEAAVYREGSEITARMQEVVTKKKGPAVQELFEILNGALGKGRDGGDGDMMTSILDGGGEELRGAKGPAPLTYAASRVR